MSTNSHRTDNVSVLIRPSAMAKRDGIPVPLGFFGLLISCLMLVDLSYADDRVSLPEGFRLSKVASDELATNIFCMIALPDEGVLVSGPGYIKKLIDTDADGKFDQSMLVSDLPNSGAQGMAVDGDDLLYVGDGGVWRLPNAMTAGDRIGGTTEKPVRLFKISTAGEHHAHSIQKGPAGWWYLIAGNEARFQKEGFSGPVTEPRAGVILRFRSDFSQRQVIAHGFRNAYDFAFNSSGQLFTFDSDGERDLGLPWYRPTRVFEIVPGDDAGWVNKSWKRPSYYPDMPRLIGEAGRASPTGVVCYHGNQFPADFQDSIFCGDWTFGRVLVCKRDHATGEYGPPVDFASAKGSFGFAVTDLAVSSKGSLLVSVGGRETAGGIWRVSAMTRRPASKVRVASGWAKSQAFAADWTSVEKSNGLQSNGGSRVDRANTVCNAVAEMVHAGPSSAAGSGLFLSSKFEAALRRVQLRLGGVGQAEGVFSGVIANEPVVLESDKATMVAELLAGVFEVAPAEQQRLELARLAAMLKLPGRVLGGPFLDQVTEASSVSSDIHYLSCLLCLAPADAGSASQRIADVLLSLNEKAQRQQVATDSHWRPMLIELASVAFERYPSVPGNVVANEAFGDAAHDYLFELFSAKHQARVQSRVIEWVSRHAGEATHGHVRVLVKQPTSQSLDAVRSLARSLARSDLLASSITLALAKHGDSSDRAIFVAGLQSLEPKVQKESAIALRRFGIELSDAEAAIALRLAMSLGNQKQDVSVRDQVMRLLQKYAGQNFGYQLKQPAKTQSNVLEQWKVFLLERNPQLKKAFKGAETMQQQLARFDRLDWSSGNAVDGKLAYHRLQCARCHESSWSVGPRLEGVTKRFGRQDLLTAIIDPDSQISERYLATMFETEDGRFFSGSIVYQNVDGVTLRESSGRTVRLNRRQILAQQKSRKSLMPTGLLDQASDQQIVDLMAFLKTL